MDERRDAPDRCRGCGKHAVYYPDRLCEDCWYGGVPEDTAGENMAQEDTAQEDTAAELVDWLADNGVHLADGRGEVPYAAAKGLIQRFLDGSRRSTAFPGGVAPRLVLEAPELTAHQEAAALDVMPDEVLERLPGHAKDGSAGCLRCARLREYLPMQEARHDGNP